MKKSILFLVGLIAFASTQAQFVPPTSSETIYPTAAMDIVIRPQHTSCYEMDLVGGFGGLNNLFVHSWNSSATAGETPVRDGFAWRRTGPGGSGPSFSGFELMPAHVYDLEVAFIQVSGQIKIVASYYEVGVGHKYRIYNWLAGGVSLYASGVLSTSTTYGRISLDAHKLYAAAITWEVGGQIYVKVLDTNSGPLTVGNTRSISGATMGSVPDVAFAHAGGYDLSVRISYANTVSGDIHTIRQDHAVLLAGTGSVTFATDDINPASFPSFPLVMASAPLASNNLQLDCPDHHDTDNWSYIYTEDAVNIKARIKTGGTTFGITLTTPTLTSSYNFSPTLAYEPGGTKIQYGWCTDYAGAPVPGYVSRELSESGAVLSPVFPNEYKVVANTTDYASWPVMSFSKQNDFSARLFAVYPMLGIGGSSYEMRYKTVLWTSTSFRPETTALAETEMKQGILVSPNPFTGSQPLRVDVEDQLAIYRVTLSDVFGRNIFMKKEAVSGVNSALAECSQTVPCGVYFLKVENMAKKSVEVFKVIKQ